MYPVLVNSYLINLIHTFLTFDFSLPTLQTLWTPAMAGLRFACFDSRYGALRRDFDMVDFEVSFVGAAFAAM